tara:strand:+ start:636 stop:992 length:357 start_codon:yes stop_codon:yes gene_type:complete
MNEIEQAKHEAKRRYLRKSIIHQSSPNTQDFKMRKKATKRERDLQTAKDMSRFNTWRMMSKRNHLPEDIEEQITIMLKPAGRKQTKKTKSKTTIAKTTKAKATKATKAKRNGKKTPKR